MKIITQCRHCSKEFEKEGQNHAFCSKECRGTYKTYHTEYRKKHPIKQLLKSAKNRAKVRGILFDLKEEEIVLPEVCPILGIKLQSNVGEGSGGYDNSYSLDRIVPDLGYVKGNVQVISNKANSMKFTATTEELKRFSEWIQRNVK